MTGRIARLCILLLLLVLATGAAAEGVPAPVQRVMDALHIPESDLGIIVQPIGSKESLVSVNPAVPRNPASAIKILTTLTALEKLGPAYVWPTEVYASGEVRNGVLNGDLVFKGYGDPYLVTEELWKIVQALRRQGLAEIRGDMVVDNGYFQVPDEDPGSFDNRPFHAYNVLPDAFLVNFKAIYFHFIAGARSNSVSIRTDPELPNLEIDNRLTTVNGHCGGYQRGIAVMVPDPATADRVVFEGHFPRACGAYVLSRSLLTPQTYAYGVFKSLWEQSGGTLRGGVRIGHAPQGRRPLLTWRSRPLGDIIRLVNKFSNNVMTRQVLLTLGAEIAGEPGTTEHGIGVIRDYLTEKGIDISSLVMINGAGLSRETRASPRLLADVLVYADSIPYMPEFVSSFSILGLDGTAKNRFSNHREAGHAHVKTGTIDHVSAIAGYVDAASGRRFVLVGILNHTNAHRGPGEQLWNSLIRWTFTQ